MRELLSKRDRYTKALHKIGWGYFFIHVHFNLGTLDILPDWIGFLLILGALPILAGASPSALLLHPLGIFLAVNAGILWCVKLFGFSGNFIGPLQDLLGLYGLFTTVVTLYFHFQLLTDIANTAKAWYYDRANAFLRTRTWYTVLLTVIQILLRIPSVSSFLLTGLVVVNLCIAFVICRQMLVFATWVRHFEDPADTEQL